MTTAVRVLTFGLQNQLRNRWILGYGLLFALLTDALFRFGGSGPRVVVSLLNVVLLVIPLVSVVFGTLHLSNSREFIELLLAQPVNRRQLYGGLYLGLTLPLVLAFVIGLGTPFLLHGSDGSAIGTLAWLLTSGVVLTCVFTGIASLIALRCEDRLRGLGAAIGAWMLLTVVYDGFVLFVLAAFSSYPLEHAALGLMLANPIDIARVSLLLRFDGAAMMGYTGAVFLDFFGKGYGMAITAAALSLWVSMPLLFGMRVFERKDF